MHALERTRSKRFLGDNNAQWDANKIAVGKFLPGAGITVVPQHFNTSARELTVELFCFGRDIRVAA